MYPEAVESFQLSFNAVELIGDMVISRTFSGPFKAGTIAG
jgi:hypothetical protein